MWVLHPTCASRYEFLPPNIVAPFRLAVQAFIGPAIATFVVAAIAIIPLSGLMGHATKNLAETLGSGIGGLLNATFGDSAELIVALAMLRQGPQMFPLIKASFTGSTGRRRN